MLVKFIAALKLIKIRLPENELQAHNK